MKVLFLIEGWSAPAPRYRVLQYLPFLESKGVQATVRALHDEKPFRWERTPVIGKAHKFLTRLRRLWHLRDAHQFDIVFLQRPTIPFTAFIERRLFRKNKRVIFDFDDAIFQTEHGDDARRMDTFRQIVDGSAMIIGGSQYLADTARPDARVIPTVIDTERYVPVQKTREEVVIGWIGTHSNYPNFPEIAAALQTVLDKYPKTSLRIVSNYPPPFNFPRMRYDAWSKDREIADLQDFDIGLMPLRDTAWNRGKCAFKIIEYMAVGIPVIAGPVGANNEVVLQGETGYLTPDVAAWTEALSQLIEDKALRQRLGAKGRERCVAKYSVISAQEQLYQALCDTRDGAS